MLGWIGSLGIFYGTVCGVMYAAQRYLMYFPDTHISAPSAYGLSGVQDIMTDSKDGTPIQLWVSPARANFPTIIYFTGNAGNLSHRASEFKLWVEHGFGLVALSYRGYGKSQGNPTEEGLYDDARTAIAYAQNSLKTPDHQIVLYGESLGTGVAIQMATEFSLGALILEAPYTSTADRGAELYPYLPVRLIMKDQFRSSEKIGQVKTPVQIFHGEKDTIIPVEHGRALFALANEPKEAHFYPNIGHVDFDIEDQMQTMIAFLTKHRVMR